MPKSPISAQSLFPGFKSPRVAAPLMADLSTRAGLTESDADLAFKQACYFEETIYAFRDNPSARGNIMEWVRNPAKGPFTFQNCARLYGLPDPDAFADALEVIYRDMLS